MIQEVNEDSVETFIHVEEEITSSIPEPLSSANTSASQPKSSNTEDNPDNHLENVDNDIHIIYIQYLSRNYQQFPKTLNNLLLSRMPDLKYTIIPYEESAGFILFIRNSDAKTFFDTFHETDFGATATLGQNVL